MLITIPAGAQLVEHLTVEELQLSDGPWIDSGWPDFYSTLNTLLTLSPAPPIATFVLGVRRGEI